MADTMAHVVHRAIYDALWNFSGSIRYVDVLGILRNRIKTPENERAGMSDNVFLTSEEVGLMLMTQGGYSITDKILSRKDPYFVFALNTALNSLT